MNDTSKYFHANKYNMSKSTGKTSKEYHSGAGKQRSSKPDLDVFSGENPTQFEIDNFVNDGCLNSLNSSDVAKIFYWSVRLKKHHRIDVLQKHLIALTSRVKIFSFAAWKAKDITFLIYAMQFIQATNDGVRDYLLTLVKILNDSLKGEAAVQDVTSQGISMMMYGIKGLNSEDKEVRLLLMTLAVVFRRASCNLKNIEVGNTLFGMQSMSSEYTEVREMLAAIAPKIRNGENVMEALNLSNALYGMRNMSSEYSEVLDVLSALSEKVEYIRTEFGSQETGNVFYGLRNMSSDEAEVRRLVSALTPKVCCEL